MHLDALLAASPGTALPALPADLLRALAQGSFAHVCPLRADATESTCHGRVWFAWLDGSLVVETGADRWRAACIVRGLDRARVWVDDRAPTRPHEPGREAFRSAPVFDARARIERDPALLERVLAHFDARHPIESPRWRQRIRAGFDDGSRVLIRYLPDATSARGFAAPVVPIARAVALARRRPRS